MRKIPTVKRVMTPFPHSVEPDLPVEEAIEMMGEHDFHHLPIVDGGRFAGLLSERLLRQFVASDPGVGGSRPVREAPIGEAFVVDIDDRLDHVAMAMAERHQDAAVVLKQGRIVGIFTSTDACRALAELLRSEFPVGGDAVA